MADRADVRSRRAFLRGVAVASAGLALGSFATSCGTFAPGQAGSSSSEKLTVSEDLTKYKGVELTAVCTPGSSRAIAEAAMKLFMEKSGAKVNLVDYPMSEMITKYTTSFLAGKHQYDVVAILNENVSQFIKGLIPLDDIVTDPAFSVQTIVPSLTPEFRGADGKLYGIPFRWGSDLLHYRRDLFEKYNVKVPTTWDEYFEAAKALTVDTPDGKVFGTDLKLVKGYPGVWHYSGWLWSAGGDISDAKYEKAFLDSDQAVAAAEQIRRLMPYAPPGVANWTQDEQITNFDQGRTAMSIGYSTYGFNYSNPQESKVVGKVGWALPPRRNGDKTPAGVRFLGDKLSQWSMMSAWGFSVTKTSPNKEAAAAMVRFLASADVQKLIAIQFGSVPNREEVFKDPEYQKSLDDKQMQGWAKASEEGGKAGYAFLGYNGHHAEMIESVQVPVQEACIGTRPVKDCLNDAQTSLTSFLADVVRKSS